MKLSVVILAKNEQNSIAQAIESVLFADEIIIINDESTDKTIEITKKVKHQNLQILNHPLEQNFSQQRNFGLSLARGEWVLFLDADERVTVELKYEILNAINSEHDGFYISRQDFLWGKKLEYGETGNIKLLRLARKGSGKWSGAVHEVWNVKGSTSSLAYPLLHYPHATISDFLAKVNYYSTIRAEELYRKKVYTNAFLIFAYTKAKFFKNYFFLRGYKDGTAGFVHAMIMSFHSFLTRGKLYLLWKGIKNI